MVSKVRRGSFQNTRECYTFFMFAFFPNAIGALVGIFLALLLAANLSDMEIVPVKEPPREEVSFEDILPEKTVTYLKEGLDVAELHAVTETVAATTTDKSEAVAPPSASLPPPPVPKPEPKKIAPSEPTKTLTLSATVLNALVREATVNIFCTLRGEIDAASGSGVIIDNRGIVLTNAHVAQYFLLDTRHGEEFVQCAIRTGSPAEKSFSGELLYIPSAWIETHAANIAENERKEKEGDTGEHDYALVRIVLPAGEATSSLSALPPAYDGKGLAKAESVLVASYPAGFLGAQAIQKNLWQISSFTSIKELYRFATTSSGLVDIFSVPGTIGAQEGSSGGALARAEDGTLLGVVVTRSMGDTTGERDLFSLSIPYINADIATDLKKTLQEFLASDIDAYQEWFNTNVRPRLKERLMREIEG